MKNRIVTGAAVLFVSTLVIALSQATATAGLLDRVLPKAAPADAVSTSINDARPIAQWLDDTLNEMTPEDGKTFDLKPGYYRFTVRSYCLHAGTYGPTRGDGYLLATLKGGRAGMIRSILDRSTQHPDIQQSDVQELIWDIEAGVKFQDVPPDFAARVIPLLSPGDIAALNVDAASIADRFLPDSIKNALAFYTNFRQKLVDPASSFEDLEKVAVLPGNAPWGKGSLKDIPAGNWSYAGDGFFIRTFPESYSTTVMEVLNPAPYRIERDDRGRIVKFESGKDRIEVTYDDLPGRNVISSPGQPDIPIWRFKTIHFIGANPGEDFTVEGKGWVVPSAACSYNNAGTERAHIGRFDDTATGEILASIGSLHQCADPGEITLEEYNERVQGNLGLFNRVRRYVDLCRKNRKLIADISGNGDATHRRLAATLVGDNDSNDMGSLKNFHDGMKAATNPEDFKGKREWIDHNVANTMNAFNQASSALAGQSSDNNGSRKFNAAGNVSVPANTSQQRLALSSFSK